MDKRDDTLGKTGAEANVIQLTIVKGEKPEPSDVHDSCADTLNQIDQVKEQILEEKLTSMILFAITSDGEYTKVLLSKNRFELIGLAEDVAAYVREELTYRSDPD